MARVSIEAMRFLRPVAVGDEVSCYCSLGDKGDTSIAVRIETWVRDRTDSDPEKVTEGVFTYVALDDDGKPRELARNDAGGHVDANPRRAPSSQPHAASTLDPARRLVTARQ